jgi:hypothetical protein
MSVLDFQPLTSPTLPALRTNRRTPPAAGGPNGRGRPRPHGTLTRVRARAGRQPLRRGVR